MKYKQQIAQATQELSEATGAPVDGALVQAATSLVVMENLGEIMGAMLPVTLAAMSSDEAIEAIQAYAERMESLV